MAQTKQLAAPTYLVGFALLLIPPIDTMMQLIPLRLQDPRWRFGWFGLISNSLMLALAGLLVVFVAANVFEHRRLQRVLGIIAAVAAVLFLIALGMFALDTLQLRKEIAPKGQLAYKVASLTAAIKGLLGIATLSAFGVASFRGPKAPKPVTEKRASLIVGGKTGSSASQTPVVPKRRLRRPLRTSKHNRRFRCEVPRGQHLCRGGLFLSTARGVSFSYPH